MKVLYVEDDLRDADITLRMLRKTMPSMQIEVLPTLESARTRLSHVTSNPLDLVLTDLHLSDGDGLTLLKHIRKNSIPVAVVVVTGMGEEDTAVAALKARADDYVVKRKDYLDRLPAILESAINHYRVDLARRMRPVDVIYVAYQVPDVEELRSHLALHAHHIHLHVVFSAAEALHLLRNPDSQHYEVLLLDFELPGLRALEVLRDLHETPEVDVPVVILCTPENERLASECLKRGATSYVVKRPGYLYQLPWELEDAHSRAELMRREAALGASEARNRAILNAIPDLMFLQKLDGTYLDYHAKDPAALLLPPEQFLGKKMQDVLPPQLATDLAECFQRAIESEKPALLEYSLTVLQGPRVYEASVVKCDDERILSTVRDIT